MNENTNNENSQITGGPEVIGNDYNQPANNKLTIDHGFAGCTIISIGQGGGTLGFELEKKLRKIDELVNLISINTAEMDLKALDIPNENKFLIGDGSGAGKNRDYAKEVFFPNDNPVSIFDKIVQRFKDKLFGENRVVLVVFSSGGGTGSSIGPRFTYMLQKFTALYDEPFEDYDESGNKMVKPIDNFRPAVIGVCLTPDFESDVDSGIDTLQNTMLCMEEIDKIIQSNAGTFCLVKNKISNNGKLFDDTNKKVTEAFVKFIRLIGFSNNGNLDVKDRFKALNLPGLISFSDLSDPNRYNMYVPSHGSKILNCVAELAYKDNYENKLKEWKNFVKNFLISDQTVGWNDLSLSSNPNDYLRNEDIVLYSGYKHLENILEPLKTVLDRKMKSLETENVNGEAFDGIKEIQEKRQGERTKAIVENLF